MSWSNSAMAACELTVSGSSARYAVRPTASSPTPSAIVSMSPTPSHIRALRGTWQTKTPMMARAMATIGSQNPTVFSRL